MGSITTVNRALALIREGALDGHGSVTELAQRLGVGARYLNKLFQRELGVGPSDVAKNQRLLLARQLIVQSELSLTQIAYAAGFGSVRRFNSAIREAFGSAPGALRRTRTRIAQQGVIRLELRYRPPYDWNTVLSFFARHAISDIETVENNHYTRRLKIADDYGTIKLSQLARRDALQLDLDLPGDTPLLPLVAQARRAFDLDANPAAIAATLGEDPLLAPLLAAKPGIRCPGYWSANEAAVRAIVGQQISTAGARRVCGDLARACHGNPASEFPEPQALLRLADKQFPMPGRRRETLRALGRLCDNEGGFTAQQLADIKGVGPWTSAIVDLRGWGDPNAFPAGDLGIVQAWTAITGSPDGLQERSRLWQPFRGYAANLLWSNL